MSPLPGGGTAAPTVVGVDVGGTKIELALVDPDGAILTGHRLFTRPERGAQYVIADLASALRDHFADVLRCGHAVGVAVAGQVDRDGVVRGAPNLGWTDLPLRDELEQTLGVSVVVVNDVRAATVAEWRHGAGRGSDDLVVLFLGTGIGGGIVAGGRMLDGCGNAAGELGHTTLIAGGRQCHCRNRGCLEAYTAGWSIAERARTAAREGGDAASALIARAGSIDAITSGTLREIYEGGDPLARRLIEETGELLGAGIVSFVNAFNPCRVILGGGVLDGFPVLLELAERFVHAHALPAAVETLRLLPAALGNLAPAIGAAVLARETLATSRGHASVLADL